MSSAEIRFDGPHGVDGGFTQVPNWILRDPSLRLSDKMVYAALLSYAWDPKRRSTFTGQQTVADDLGCDVATVKRAMARLRTAGLLVSERRGLGRTSVHTLKWQNAPTDGAERADRRGTGAPTVGALARRQKKTKEKNTDPPLSPPVRLSKRDRSAAMKAYGDGGGEPAMLRALAERGHTDEQIATVARWWRTNHATALPAVVTDEETP